LPRTLRIGPGAFAKAWSFLYRQRLSRAQAYAELKKLEFTSKQVESLLTATEM
jgi:hypothetical protein